MILKDATDQRQTFQQSTLYLICVSSMPCTSLPKSSDKSVDMPDYAIFERKIRLPNQGPVAKNPKAFCRLDIVFAIRLRINFLDHISVLTCRYWIYVNGKSANERASSSYWRNWFKTPMFISWCMRAKHVLLWFKRRTNQQSRNQRRVF